MGKSLNRLLPRLVFDFFTVKRLQEWQIMCIFGFLFDNSN